MNLCFVEFAIASEEQFRQLEAVVAALCEAKKTNLFPPAAYWLDFFDAKATSFFWHPTEPEFKDWKRRWFATPVEERWNEQTL
jgi:hypothetical protein